MEYRGHRGLCGVEPENTLQSFRRAKEEGLNVIEFDVRTTQDNTPVVLHDETIDRTTQGTGAINDLTYSEIRPYRIPTLEEALDELEDIQEIRLEIKEPEATQIIYETVQEKELDNVVYHTFYEDVLEYLPDREQTSFTGHDPGEVLETGREYNCNILTFHQSTVDQQLIDDAHRYGFKVDVWGIEDEEQREYIRSLQPDYMGIEHPPRPEIKEYQ